MDGGLPDPQPSGVHLVFGDVPLADGFIIGALLVCLVDDFVVNIGKILHEGDFVSPVLQIPPQHVEDAEGPGVSNMDIVIHGGAAGVHFHLSRLHGDKIFLLAA